MRDSVAELHIRLADHGDLDALIGLEGLFPSDRMSRSSFRRLIAVPSARVLVAEADGAMLGNLVLLCPARWHRARIYSVIVAPSARGRGVARALVSEAERVTAGLGRRTVFLEVRIDNAPAIGLYRAMGYVECATLPGYYDDCADGLRLEKRL